jgi:uncharacterized iron-regulated membrane protein
VAHYGEGSSARSPEAKPSGRPSRSRVSKLETHEGDRSRQDKFDSWKKCRPSFNRPGYAAFFGIYLIFATQTRSVARIFAPVRDEPTDLKSVPIPGRPPLGLAAAASIADGIFPDGTLQSIDLPAGPEGVYVVGKHADDEPNQAAPYRRVTIDQYSGKVLHVQDRANFSARETFLEWQYPLHSGEAFGNAGRAFIMFMRLVPLILYVTGFMRWRRQRRARTEAASRIERSRG